jgi:hypothetical protein
MNSRDEDELDEQQLEQVVGGLNRAWCGTWAPADLGLIDALPELTDDCPEPPADPTVVTGP